jgi:hypothetical protein
MSEFYFSGLACFYSRSRVTTAFGNGVAEYRDPAFTTPLPAIQSCLIMSDILGSPSIWFSKDFQAKSYIHVLRSSAAMYYRFLCMYSTHTLSQVHPAIHYHCNPPPAKTPPSNQAKALSSTVVMSSKVYSLTS